MADNIDVVTYSGLGRFKSQADALYGKVKSIQGLSPDNNGNVNIPEATNDKSGLMSSDDKNTISNLKSVATSGSYNDLSNKPTKLSEFENDITIGIGKLDFSISDWTNNNSIYTLSKTIGTAKFINLYRELNGNYQVICADDIVIASATLTITSPEPFNGFILVSSTEAFDESSVEELESVINNSISNLSQDIIPNESSTISLGSVEKKFAAVYADEVRISQNALYIDDTPLANVATSGNYNDLNNKPTSLPANGGNADTATKLESARNINGISFDGSADVKVPLEFHTCEVEDDNTNNYHHILSSGQCTSGWIDKTITIVVTQNTNNAGLGILRCSLRTNNVNNNEVATGEITWLIRTGFSENDFCFNLRNTPKDTYMDIFYKASSTYMGLTWYVLTEGSMGTNNSEQWTKYNTNASGTNAYTEDGMKALRTYTSTLIYPEDKGIVDQANNAYWADESYKATKFKDSVNINDTPFDGSGPITTEKWGIARTLTIGNKGFDVNGGKDITWTLSEIGAVTKTEVDEAIADNAYTHPTSGVTAGTYRSVTVDAQGHVTAGSNPTATIEQGGTGATTAEQAKVNLGIINSDGHLVLSSGIEIY